MRFILSILFLFLASRSDGQINSFYIAPSQTDINYVSGQDSHLVVRNTLSNINRLFIFLGGTGSKTQSYTAISNFAARRSYDVINISYPNLIPAARLANDTNLDAFEYFRQEVCFGTPLSYVVNVDSFNSIHTRILKLLNYLDQNFPAQNWGQYLIAPKELNWEKVTIGGHSQGSGHACYFGKLNELERVAMFAGPNDYSNHFSQGAAWLAKAGSTDLNRHFAYLSLKDEVVDFSKQLDNLRSLNLHPLYDTIHVDSAPSLFANSRCLYTTQSPGLSLLHHNSNVRLSFINNAVWAYLLDTALLASSPNLFRSENYTVFPNPTKGLINVHWEGESRRKKLEILNLHGGIIKTMMISNNEEQIDLSGQNPGCYFLRIEEQVLRIMKY